MDRITAAQVFIETVARGSMSAAADHLGISRAMASRYIATVEEWAGTRLLHRTTRKLSLTAAGEQIVPVCKELLALALDMELTGSLLDGSPKGLLRVAATSILSEYRLTDAIVDFLAKYPAMAVDLQVADRTVNLAEDGIDLAIRITNTPDPQLIARKLGECASVICASPRYLGSRGAPAHVRDLAAHNCLTYAHFGNNVWRFTSAQGTDEVAVRGSLSTNEALVLKRATVQGAGVAMLPRFAVSEELKAGVLVDVLPGFEAQKLGVFAMYLSRLRMPPSLRVLIDHLVEHLDMA